MKIIVSSFKFHWSLFLASTELNLIHKMMQRYAFLTQIFQARTHSQKSVLPIFKFSAQNLCLVDNESAWVQALLWHQTGNKWFPEQVLTKFHDAV